MRPITVLVVEDEEVAARAHAAYVHRVPGFALAGVARSGAEALRALRRNPETDLVLLDMQLPDGHGLAVLQRLRAEGFLCDAIAVTSARDVEVVQRAVAQGIVLYLLKPFTFAGFRTKLQQYAAYRQQLVSSDPQVVQSDVDQLFGRLRPGPDDSGLPKGMGPETMSRVVDQLRASSRPQSASEIAGAVGTSRVTARRYLEHLADTGRADRRARYGRSGRPELEYRWRRD